MPTPNGDEKEGDFVSRFMGNDAMQAEYPDQKQRLAVAYSQWRRHKKKYRDDVQALIDREEKILREYDDVIHRRNSRD